MCFTNRYKLLLEGMLKNTERDHPDRPLLQNAIEQIADVASFINDSIKRRENQAKIWGACAKRNCGSGSGLKLCTLGRQSYPQRASALLYDSSMMVDDS